MLLPRAREYQGLRHHCRSRQPPGLPLPHAVETLPAARSLCGLDPWASLKDRMRQKSRYLPHPYYHTRPCLMASELLEKRHPATSRLWVSTSTPGRDTSDWMCQASLDPVTSSIEWLSKAQIGIVRKAWQPGWPDWVVISWLPRRGKRSCTKLPSSIKTWKKQ